MTNDKNKIMPTIYVDLDGTLLGKNASLLHDHEGIRSTVGTDALTKAEKAGADLVVATGRDRFRASEFCRSAGIDNYIAELGSVIKTNGEEIIEYGEAASKFIEQNGLNNAEFLGCVGDAAHMLISHFKNILELHAPYNRDRLSSLLLRGNVPTDESNELLAKGGWPFLELVANGHGMFRRTMPGVDNVLIYHLVPVGISKASGILRDQEHRNLKRENCFMIGDGMADAHCYSAVNTVYIPSNGIESDPDVKAFADAHENIVILDQSHNAGFAQAIDLILKNY